MNRRSGGNIIDFLTAGLVALAIAIVVFASFHSLELMVKKLEVSQLARKYILVMETQGCLTEQVKAQMMAELEEIGLKNINITGTTLTPVDYGTNIFLFIRGNIPGTAAGNDIWSEGFGAKDFYVEEKRMSTAKN